MRISPSPPGTSNESPDRTTTRTCSNGQRHSPQGWSALSVAAYELEAWILKIYQGQIVPGPFQTEDTIRAQLSAARNVVDLESAVQKRLARQQAILDRKDQPYSTAIQDEACVELARFPLAVAVRDSKNPGAGHLALTRRQFAGLTQRIKTSD